MESNPARIILIVLLLFNLQSGPVHSADDRQQDEASNYEFAHLLKRAEQTKRVHLISEIVFKGQQVQIEEFLDLSNYNQRIQFKWHELSKKSSVAPGSQENKRIWRQNFSTKRLDLLLLNGEQDAAKKVMYQFEPFKCESAALEENSDEPWQKYVERPGDVQQLISSIKSLAHDSPYLASIDTEQYGRVSVLGVAGLWLRAGQSRLSHSRDGSSSSWRLSPPDSSLSVDYFLETSLLDGHKTLDKSKGTSNAQFDLINFVEIKDQQSNVLHSINIIDAEFSYSDQMARSLYSLPIGFNCPANVQLARDGLYFREKNPNEWLELEMVATRWTSQQLQVSGWPIEQETDVRNFRVAQSRHPLALSRSLYLFHSLEDRQKLILDYNSNLRYEIHLNGTEKQHCQVNHLLVAKGGPADEIYDPDDEDEYYDENFNEQDDLTVIERQRNVSLASEGETTPPGEQQTLDDSFEIAFNNGLTVELNPDTMDYLLGVNAAEQKSARLLNRLESSGAKYEFVFEADVPRARRQMIRLKNRWGNFVAEQMSIVRVYEQVAVGGSVGLPIKRMRRRGFITLSRVVLLIFSEDRREKLAELRLNLGKRIQQMSLARRACIFDLSHCRANLLDESMELTATYAADEKLLAYARENTHELLETFYSNYLRLRDQYSSEQEEKMGETIASFNFLRMPRVELSERPPTDDDDPVESSGELELRLTLLDKLSPLARFEQLSQSKFEVNDPDDERVFSMNMLGGCANLCRLSDCKMFAYNSLTYECKISDLRAPKTGAVVYDDSPVKIIGDTSSVVYYEPEQQANEVGLGEIDWFLGELNRLDQWERQEDKQRSRRLKRSLVRDSLFSLDFVDRSAGEYAPPVTRKLAPTQIRVSRLPLYNTFDVRQRHLDDEPQRVASSFKTQQTGKCYKVTILDEKFKQTDPLVESLLSEPERTFIDHANAYYFTLQRLDELDLSQCQLFCFNIEEFRTNSERSSDHICIGLSYESLRKQCHLLIRTSFGHVKSVRDLGVREGDRVRDLATPEELAYDNPDCVLQTRNYMSDFVGPIRLAPGFSTYQTTDSFESPLDLEWLPVFVIDSAQPETVDRDECVAKCVARNKDDKNFEARSCLAVDFCSQVTYNAKEQLKRYKISCNLLLVRPLRASDADKRQHLSRLRSHLIGVTAPTKQQQQQQQQRADSAAAAASTSDTKTIKHECNRYIWSQLREFNYLTRGRISAAALEHLTKLSDEQDAERRGFDLDSCALNCYLIGRDCLGFQFCMSVASEQRAESAADSLAESGLPRRTIQRSCTLFGGPRTRFSGAERHDEPSAAPARPPTTEFDKNCHIYARAQFKSVGEILQLDLVRGDSFEHSTLTFVFLAAYLLVGVCFAIYLVSRFRSRVSS